MRWPGQPAPGMVRISRRELIELQGRALRTHELEREIRHHRQDEAVSRVRELLFDLSPAARADAEVFVADPPLTRDGRLHEAGLTAAVQAVVWARRERELAVLVANDRDGGRA